MVYEPDLLEIRELVDQHYITERKHRSANLFVYNYTPKTVYNRYWNEHTINCRGLILDGNGRVAARGFPKFWNMHEMGTEWLDEPFDIYEKLDGSLLISYVGPDGWAVATRGSFQSVQATEGTKILNTKYKHLLDELDPMLTYLFELIVPENRVVVDYGATRDIVLLAVVDTVFGNELPLDDRYGFPVVKRYEGLSRSALELSQLDEDPNREGYVIRFASGQRAKLKLELYNMVHRLVTQVTPRRIWEILSTGDNIMPLVAKCPPAYQQWVHQNADKLLNQYQEIERRAQQQYTEISTVFTTTEDMSPRQQRGLYAQKVMALGISKIEQSILFAMYDHHDFSEIVWKMIYPDASAPYKVEV